MRYQRVIPNGSGNTGFSLIPPEATGVRFTNTLSDQLVARNRVTENGSGVALGDIDGDGWCDIYLCGLEKNNVLYRNLGDWRFEDATLKAGLACERQLSTGAVFADIDGDGDLDLLVNSLGGGTRAFLNDGKGRFTELTAGRLVKRFGSTSLALGDLDADGDLDLYVANYRTVVSKDEFPRPKVEARMQNGQIVVTPPGRFTAIGARNGAAEVFELAERDFLYLNTGQGIFAPVSWTNGNFFDELSQPLASTPLDWALSVLIRDLNGDGRPDILTCNDFFNSPDRVWMQQGGAGFRLLPFEALRKVSLASMAADVADINRDGFDDLFFVEMLSRDYTFRQSHRDNLLKSSFNTRMAEPFRREVPRNTLFLNRGDGTYSEIAEFAGVDASEWSWGAVFLDVNLDGYEDLLVPTGHNHDVQDADILRSISQRHAPDSIEQRMRDLARFPPLNTPILAFHNLAGTRFEEAEWGLGIPGVANGFACADLDNDGDLDLVANRLNGAALLFRNNSSRERIAVRLKGRGANTRAIGAKIRVRGGPVPQQQEIVCGGRYLSCDDTMRVFATGGNSLEMEVQWPNRTRSIFSNLPGNCLYELVEPANALPLASSSAPPPAMFEDVTSRLGHRHGGALFDDFQRQPLLPYSLSSQGPALAWFDLDRDGRDDLLIGAGRGDHLRIYRNVQETFIPVTNEFTSRTLLEDSMAMMAASLTANEVSLLVSVGNYQSALVQPASVELISLSSGEKSTLPGSLETPGALALGDIDGDGDLDIFVASRVLPGRYPQPASSQLYKNRNGKFLLDTNNSSRLLQIGLVTSAQFVDLNNDTWPDLLLACEWGPLRIFLNDHGTLTQAALGLENYSGWWTGIATGDFNNDGLTDIVAGNWGRNTKYERFLREKPLRLYYGDLDANGTFDIFECIFNPKVKKYVPLASPEAMIDFFPPAAERFPTYKVYSIAGIEEVLGRSAESVPMLQINTMDSTCFINHLSNFEARPLPMEAQFAPVFGLGVGDFDNDGNEDLLLGQNLFDTRWETGRLDSGRPTVLRGNGTGAFKTMSTLETGLAADGQQRAIALADFNNDGRLDAAISQHNGETKLFQNRTAPSGIRLRFRGSASNPDAIGTRFRVIDSNGPSPICEIQCGTGWLSQDSFTKVIARPAVHARIAITWPGGVKSEFPLPPDAGELAVSEAGIELIRRP
ncbi:MAG TPA: VCBS repeat-containing protein [Verrucomicrobiae bacterium]|nr:VCBS repeat-containing protein [Verrucomicrobiae bacterium]